MQTYVYYYCSNPNEGKKKRKAETPVRDRHYWVGILMMLVSK